MAPTDHTSISQLTVRLAASRAALHESIVQMEDQMNVSRRVRNDIAAHPLKWFALAAGAGYAGLRLIPVVLRLTRKSWSSALVAPMIQAAAAAALPLAAEAVSRSLAKSDVPLPPPVPRTH